MDREAFNAAFGNFIREGRENKGMLQSDVSLHLGVSIAYYSYLELGKRNIDLKMALDICSFLGLNMNEFVAFYKRKTRNKKQW